MLKMMERKDNVKGEFDRPNSLVYQARGLQNLMGKSSGVSE